VLSGVNRFEDHGDRSLHVLDISNPANPESIGSVKISGCESIVASAGSLVYVSCIIANRFELQVIDVNLLTTKTIGRVENRGETWGVSVSGSAAYVLSNYSAAYVLSAADWHHSLQVVDISNPLNPKIIGSIDTPGPANGISVSGSIVYVATSGLQMIDVSNPTNPNIIGSVDTPGYAYGVSVSGSIAYLAEGGYGSGLQVIDVSNPINSKIIGSVNTPGFGWGLAVSGSTAYVADGYNSGLQVVDVSDPKNPKIISSIGTSGGVIRRVSVSGSLAYVADYNGLRVIDISDPQNPKIIGSLDTPGDALGVSISGSTAYVMGESLHAVDISNPSNPVLIGTIGIYSYDAAIVGNNAVMASDYNGLIIAPLPVIYSQTILPKT